jgi:hypothetical protein
MLDHPLQQLPCPNLLELKLGWGCDVQLGPADGYPGVIQGCTKLTNLELRCTIIDAPDLTVLDGSLSSLVQLQHLWVNPYDYDLGFAGLADSTLPCLRNLTYLEVRSLSVGNLQQLGGLTNLRGLDVMQMLGPYVTVGPSSVPGLVFPASLKTLDWSSPAEAGLMSLVPTGLRDLRVMCTVEGPAQGPDSVLYGMERLKRLTWLVLSPGRMDWPPASPAYSALTASSNLVYLKLLVTRFPTGVWQYMFPNTTRLPHLTELWLKGSRYDGALDTSSRAGAADLSRLVCCCPSLSVMHTMCLQPGLHVSELCKLTALTRLHVLFGSGDLAAVEESVKGLAAITQLQVLTISTDTLDITVASLLPLTTLTALHSQDCSWNTVEGYWRSWVDLHTRVSQ